MSVWSICTLIYLLVANNTYRILEKQSFYISSQTSKI